MISVHNREIELYLDLMILDLLTWLGPSPGEAIMSWLYEQFSLMRDRLNGPSFVMNALAPYGMDSPRHQGFLLGLWVRQIWADIEVRDFACSGTELWQLTWL